MLALIRSGRKRAFTSLLWDREVTGDPVPQVGDLGIVLDDSMTPSLVTINTKVEVIRFDEVSAEYAAIEGEGDCSLAYWTKGHWDFFSRQCASLGRQPNPAMTVVCVIFDVLHTL